MSFTTLYGLFALTSLLLFNALVLLARYARQVKEPPKDAEFDLLISEKKELQIALESKKAEMEDNEKRIKVLEEKIQKTEDALQAKLTELQALKASSSAAPATPGA